MAETALPSILKLLADPTRLRILALLGQEELSVGELTRALGMAQSRVSNHLRILREARVLTERHAGVSTHLSLAKPQTIHDALPRIWAAMKQELEALPEHQADLVRLESVLAERRARDGDFFDRVAGEWDKIAGEFETGQARLRVVNHLLPRQSVLADLGCGTGYMAESVLGHCERLICVDRSEGMLAEARKRLTRNTRGTSVEFRKGELDALPIKDGELDGLLAGMVLHHLPSIEAGLSEMYRAIRPGGTVAVLELAPHREEWMRTELGDRHLGLEPSDLLQTMRQVGFVDALLDPPADRLRPKRPDGSPVSLPLFIIRGRKPLTI
ncbi:MAG: metalloregulator ArsR/SmtB family transcription factor [Planctomycetota bacterium]